MKNLTKLTDLRMDCLWRIEKCEDGWYAADINGERVLIENKENEEICHGDVIEITQSGKVIRIHDGSSSSALVYVTNQCNSNCIMCPDSVKTRTKPNHITYEYLMEYISLLPSDLMHVDITGGEPTLLKYQLPSLIEKITGQAEEAEVLMLSNGRSFANRKYAERFADFSGKRFKIEIPVHSADLHKHDLIAGHSGSFAQTKAGIHHLLENGVEVGIRIVVSRLNYRELDSIIEFIHQEFPSIGYINIMGMEVLGNAWKNREIVWIEMDELKPYLQNALEKSFQCGIEPGLYNFPLCLFNRKYWYCYKNSISDYKIRYFDECEECMEKQKCGGFFFSTYHHTKYKVRVLR